MSFICEEVIISKGLVYELNVFPKPRSVGFNIPFYNILCRTEREARLEYARLQQVYPDSIGCAFIAVLYNNGTSDMEQLEVIDLLADSRKGVN